MAVGALALPGVGQAQRTKVWTVQRFEDVERGTTQGTSIRGDGTIVSGPAVKLLAETSTNLAWSVAPGQGGSAYVGLGGTTGGSAALLRVAPNGGKTTVWSGKELGVQAVRLAPDGSVLFATNPDGKLYRVAPAGGAAEVLFDPASLPEHPKYLWDLVVAGQQVYVAAGTPAAVYRVPLAGGKPERLFKTADASIRCLALSPDAGTLWAGSDGGGVVYRLDLRTPDAQPFAAYASEKREISALAVAPDGAVYAAAVGTRGSTPGLPPLPAAGQLGVSITILSSGSATAAQTNALVPDGSEIDRIATKSEPEGAPERLALLKEDVVYALAAVDGGVIAGTGTRGRLYRLDTTGRLPGDGVLTDWAQVEAGETTALASAPGGTLLAATSNGGKLFQIGSAPASGGTYTSEVFDAKSFSRWGRVQVNPGSHGFRMELRVGNVPKPLEGWSPWTPVGPDGRAAVPQARFAQWRVVMAPGSIQPGSGQPGSTYPSQVGGVEVNYLQRNLAPVVDAVYVQGGVRVSPTEPAKGVTTVPVQFPPPAPTGPNDSLATALQGQKDARAVTVRWTAHDDNGDDLLFTLRYRGEGETTWRLLKDRIQDHFWSFDSSTLPDGLYRVEVVADDGPAHTAADTLTGARVSEPFVVDTTPPVPGPFSVTRQGSALQSSALQATFSARDALSLISHAEWSLDGGDWQFLTPVSGLSDALEEQYRWTVPLPADSAAAEHVLAVRVFDRFENAVTAKAVIPSAGPGAGEPGAENSGTGASGAAISGKAR